MKQWHDGIRHILKHGQSVTAADERTGTGTLSVFGFQQRYNLRKNRLPIVTTKYVPFKALLKETLFFIAGCTNNNLLKAQKVNIWNKWAVDGRIPLDECFDWIYLHKPEFAEEVQIRLDSVELSARGVTDNDKDYEAEYDKLARNVFRMYGCPTETENDGELGPIYGKQWRDWICPDGRHVDQLKQLMDDLKNRPHSRRHIVTAWNVADLPDETIAPEVNAANGKMALPPCHTFMQFYVRELNLHESLRAKYTEAPADWINKMVVDLLESTNNNEDAVRAEFKKVGIPTQELSCHLYMRSNDYFIGNPFNVAQYSLLTMMIAHCLYMGAGDLVVSYGDMHLYKNHINEAKMVLKRKAFKLPVISFSPVQRDLFSFDHREIELHNYKSHEAIVVPVAK